MTETTTAPASDPVGTLARVAAFVFVAGDAVALLILTVEVLYPLAVALPDVDLTTLGAAALIVGILAAFQFVLAAVVTALLDI